MDKMSSLICLGYTRLVSRESDYQVPISCETYAKQRTGVTQHHSAVCLKEKYMTQSKVYNHIVNTNKVTCPHISDGGEIVGVIIDYQIKNDGSDPPIYEDEVGKVINFKSVFYTLRLYNDKLLYIVKHLLTNKPNAISKLSFSEQSTYKNLMLINQPPTNTEIHDLLSIINKIGEFSNGYNMKPLKNGNTVRILMYYNDHTHLAIVPSARYENCKTMFCNKKSKNIIKMCGCFLNNTKRYKTQLQKKRKSAMDSNGKKKVIKDQNLRNQP